MKWTAIIRGGCIGGLLSAVILAAIGRVLDVTIPPWDSASLSFGWIGHMIDVGRTTLLLVAPGIVVGLVVAWICAAVFEFVVNDSGVLAGLVVGLVLGVVGAELAGLVPWFGWWFTFTYAPPIRPLGERDPSWMLAALVVVGVVMGAVAGTMYGVPLRASRRRTFRWRQIYARRDTGHREVRL